MTEQPAQAHWLIPLIPAGLIAVYAVVCGYTRNSGLWFLLAFLLLAAIPMLLFLGAMLFFALRNPDRRWHHWAALGLVVAAPLLGYVTFHIRDQARFIVWAPFHRDLLNQNPETNGIVTWWETWGGLGWFNTSYLARDTNDNLSSLDYAKGWRERLGLSCEIVATRRVWRQLYVITTSECEF